MKKLLIILKTSLIVIALVLEVSNGLSWVLVTLLWAALLCSYIENHIS